PRPSTTTVPGRACSRIQVSARTYVGVARRRLNDTMPPHTGDASAATRITAANAHATRARSGSWGADFRTNVTIVAIKALDAIATNGSSGYTHRGNCDGRDVMNPKYSSGKVTRIHHDNRRVARVMIAKSTPANVSTCPVPKRSRIIA